MVREAIEVLGGAASNVDVTSWVMGKYPGTNKTTIQCQMIAGTVNHPSRVHYGVDVRSRVCDNPLFDQFFRPESGRIELYSPEQHGMWELFETPDGRFSVRQCGDEVQPSADDDTGHAFAAETHLRDYLAQHLDEIEPGLQLYVHPDERIGVEFITEVGRIDILAVDGQGAFVVIELKVARGPDSVAGQILRYKNWVKRHLANGQSVRGIIIAQQITDKIKYAIADDPEVAAKEYEIKIALRNVDKI